MKKILFIIMMLASCFIQGCGHWASIDLSNAVYIDAEGARRYHKDYQIGVKKTVYVGQEIFRVKAYAQGKSIREVASPQKLVITSINKFKKFDVTSDASSRTKVEMSVRIDKNSWRTNIGDDYYLVGLKGSDDRYWGLLMSRDGSIFQHGMYSYDDHMMFYSYDMVVTPVDFKFDVVRTETKDTNAIESFELIFSGKNDMSLNTTYREYTASDLARPAFFQNLTYQADAKQIRFKEFVILIDEVTNEKITYTILEDGMK